MAIKEDRRLRRETLRHKEAFEFYYRLGAERTLAKVSEEFKISFKSISLWSSSFNWKERIEQRDIQIGKELESNTMDLIIEQKAKYRQVVKLAMKNIIDNIQKGKVKVNMTDLDKLVRLDMYLMGESESTVAVNNNHTLSFEDKEMIKGLGKNLGALVDELGED